MKKTSEPLLKTGDFVYFYEHFWYIVDVNEKYRTYRLISSEDKSKKSKSTYGTVPRENKEFSHRQITLQEYDFNFDNHFKESGAEVHEYCEWTHAYSLPYDVVKKDTFLLYAWMPSSYEVDKYLPKGSEMRGAGWWVYSGEHDYFKEKYEHDHFAKVVTEKGFEERDIHEPAGVRFMLEVDIDKFEVFNNIGGKRDKQEKKERAKRRKAYKKEHRLYNFEIVISLLIAILCAVIAVHIAKDWKHAFFAPGWFISFINLFNKINEINCKEHLFAYRPYDFNSETILAWATILSVIIGILGWIFKGLSRGLILLYYTYFIIADLAYIVRIFKEKLNFEIV